MNSRRDSRVNRSSLFDDIEVGSSRASSSYTHEIEEIEELENDPAMDNIEDRVIMLKRLTAYIDEEVDFDDHMLDTMGFDMDSSRGILSETMDKLKMVFETRSGRRMFMLVASSVVIFLIIYYLTRNHVETKGFKHVEPVRKKSERENLQGLECKQCKNLYDAVLPDAGGRKEFTEHHDEFHYIGY